jgi:hypothetical protein
MRAKVALKDVDARENDAKAKVVRKYSPACPKVKLWTKCL